MIGSIFFIAQDPRESRSVSLLFFALAAFLSVQALLPIDPAIALVKIDGFLVGGLFVYLIFRRAVDRHDESFYTSFVVCGLVILSLTIAYKLLFGFWDRQVRFFLNGPIIFGWIMATMCLLCLRRYVRGGGMVPIVTFFLFFLAVIWTGSKGPLIAMGASGLFFLIASRRLGALSVVVGCTVLAFLTLSELNLLPERFSVFQRLLSSDLNDSDAGSIGIRQQMLRDSISVFWQNPILGVGISNWIHFSDDMDIKSYEFVYPHNFFGEALAEYGLVGATFFLLILTWVFIRADAFSRALIILFLTALQFTGDMSYWRFLYFLPLALSTRNKLSL
ncbi:O-antigen ligase family protein [Pararhodobacter aggregans]|nr:O-antigen ligase family protein [Pararhodobacter aggregans]